MRTLFQFHGGIQPPDNKQQSVRTPIACAGIPPELVLPLDQYAGAPATPVVQLGQRVLKGELIAATASAASAPVHAPTSGTVRAIEDRVIAHPSGLAAPCIVIATDGQDTWVDHHGAANYLALDRDALIKRIHDAGIAGMGGAGFPSAAKLSATAGTTITTLIINGAECEPYITCDDMLMRERAMQVIEGAKILRHILAPGETLVGVEDNKPEALQALRAAAQDAGIEIVAIPARYPSGGEKQLIEIFTGKQVPAGTLPAQIGVVCLNVASVAAIFEAVTRGRPLISRITTVTGMGVREPQNFDVLLGTPMRFLLERAGYHADAGNRLIMGGSMMGFTVPDVDVPIVKTTNCVLAPGADELPPPPPAQACIRCGLCADACPASLLPQQLFWFAQGREFAKLEQHNLFDCIECGACAYVCPSAIPLVQYYRASKSQLLQLRCDQATADASRLRFEARQQRLQRDEAEEAARRAERKWAIEHRAQSGGEDAARDDPIRAAIERARARKAALHAGGKDSELARLEHTVVSAHQRLQTASAKLEEAIAQGSDRVEALQASVANTRAKLDAAEQALRNRRRSQPEAAMDASPAEVIQSTVEKANTARAHDAARNPQDQARAELEKLQQLLRQSQESLARCRENGEQVKVIFALESTVARLTEQVDHAQRHLQTARED